MTRNGCRQWLHQVRQFDDRAIAVRSQVGLGWAIHVIHSASDGERPIREVLRDVVSVKRWLFQARRAA